MDKKTFLMFLLLTFALLPSVFSIDFPVDVPRTLTTSSDQSYSYENTNGFFQVWYGDDPSTGNVVKFQADGVDMTLLPMALNWNNDLSQIQQISMPQSVSGVPSGSDMLYSNAYGSGRHLRYETQQDKVKEKIIIDSLLPAPAQYVIDGGNPQLEIGFQLASAGKIFIDDVEWDKASEVETTNDVVVKDSSDNVVYTLPRPFATDSADETVFGKYIFKESANKLYVRIYIPYSWLNDSARVYPITIDPTFQVDYSPIPATHIYTGNVVTYSDSSFPYQDNVVTGVSDNLTSTRYETNRYAYLSQSGWSIFYKAGEVNYTSYVLVQDTIATPDLNIDGVAKAIQLLSTNTIYTNAKIDVVMRCDDINKYVRFSNSDFSVIYGSFYCNSSSLSPYSVTLTNIPPAGVTDIRISDGVQGGAMHTYWDYISVKQYSATLGKALMGRWSQTYDPVYNWYLLAYITTTGSHNISVYAYQNSDVISTQYVQKYVSSTGWFNIDVSSLLNYEKNTQNLTFTQLRIFSEYPKEISEIRLRKEVNDTQPPTIVNCFVTDTYLGCLDTLTAECNVTDDVDVDIVNFIANNVSYELYQDGDLWKYDFEPTYDGFEIYDWTEVRARDIAGNNASIDPNITVTYNCSFDEYINIQHQGIVGIDQIGLTNDSVTITWTTSNPSDTYILYGLSPSLLNETMFYSNLVTNHSIGLTNLIPSTIYYYTVKSSVNPTQNLSGFNFTTLSSCIEDWVLDAYSCLTNDTYFATYTDQNLCNTTISLPPQNGTYQYCNYCSEQLVQILGDCQQNNSQSVDYIDLNYITCCAVTGLVSDCSILYYPYNETTSQYCMYFNNTMTTIECQNEPNFNLREKEYCLSYIPNQYLNETFKCISHVKDQVTGEILQTNPEYRERAQSFVDLFKKDPETREWFTPASAIVNFYYTDKNLHPESQYILTIECSSQQRTLTSSMLFQMAYEDYEFVFFRTRWLMANAGYIIAGLIVILIIMFVLFLIWRTGKG